jgi:hypothetical protein
MEINPNRNVDPALAAGGVSKSRIQARGDSNETSFENSASLNAALEATPDSRADVVSRAEDLVSSSEYPPREVINRIANLLAANLIVEQN